MIRPCKRCNEVDVVDDGHLICYDCFVELDLAESEEE